MTSSTWTLTYYQGRQGTERVFSWTGTASAKDEALAKGEVAFREAWRIVRTTQRDASAAFPEGWLEAPYAECIPGGSSPESWGIGPKMHAGRDLPPGRLATTEVVAYGLCGNAAEAVLRCDAALLRQVPVGHALTVHIRAEEPEGGASAFRTLRASASVENSQGSSSDVALPGPMQRAILALAAHHAAADNLHHGNMDWRCEALPVGSATLRAAALQGAEAKAATARTAVAGVLRRIGAAETADALAAA